MGLRVLAQLLHSSSRVIPHGCPCSYWSSAGHLGRSSVLEWALLNSTSALPLGPQCWPTGAKLCRRHHQPCTMCYADAGFRSPRSWMLTMSLCGCFQNIGGPLCGCPYHKSPTIWAPDFWKLTYTMYYVPYTIYSRIHMYIHMYRHILCTTILGPKILGNSHEVGRLRLGPHGSLCRHGHG